MAMGNYKLHSLTSLAHLIQNWAFGCLTIELTAPQTHRRIIAREVRLRSNVVLGFAFIFWLIVSPKLTRQLYFAVVTGAGLSIYVIPVVLSSFGITVPSLAYEPAKRSRQ